MYQLTTNLQAATLKPSKKHTKKCKWCGRIRSIDQMPRHYRSKGCKIARSKREVDVADLLAKEDLRFLAAMEKLKKEHAQRREDIITRGRVQSERKSFM